MKKYNITVNGTAYEVEVEEVGGAPSIAAAAPAAKAAPAPAASAPDAPAAAPAAAPAPAPKAAPAPAAPSAGAVVIESPMPGTILDVLKKPGDAVAADEVILILEAMKMETEITTPRSGKVTAILVAQGDPVQGGQGLLEVE